MDGRERLARQQAALAELGRLVVTPAELGRVLQDAVELVAATLEVEHATVLELPAEGGDVRLRAGVGWAEGDVGHAVDAMPGGHVAFTLDAIEPVIVSDLTAETRFAPSPLLLEDGVRASLAVRIPGPAARPFGVLGVHTREPRAFTTEEAGFLAAVATVMASAIGRHRRALEINDEILQTLVLAQYALRHGHGDAAALLDRAIARTRGMVSTLLGIPQAGHPQTLPGDLRRSTPADVSSGQDETHV